MKTKAILVALAVHVMISVAWAAVVHLKYSLSANTSYSIVAEANRQRVIIQNLSNAESIWVAPGEDTATVSASIRVLPLKSFAGDYDSDVPIAVIASTAQDILIVQKGG